MDVCIQCWMSIAALLTLAKTWKQPKCPSTGEWVRRRWDRYTMGYSSSIKGRNSAICTKVGGTRDAHTKQSPSERETPIPYDSTYTWTLIHSTNDPFHGIETQGLGEGTCACQQGQGGSGMDWASGLKGCKPLHLDWISNESPLDCTGNNIQSLTKERDRG